MKNKCKYVTVQALNHYFNDIHHKTLDAIRNSFKGTPHIKKTNSRLGNSTRRYYLYDLEKILEMGFKPIKDIPSKLIRS